MMDNTVKIEVEDTPENLWERFLRPEKLESIIPEVESIEPIGDGVYLAKLGFMGMDISAKVKEEWMEKPRIVELKSGDPFFHLKAELEEIGNPRTRVEIRVRTDPPSFFGMLDDQIKEELEERMEEQARDMKKRAERG